MQSLTKQIQSLVKILPMAGENLSISRTPLVHVIVCSHEWSVVIFRGSSPSHKALGVYSCTGHCLSRCKPQQPVQLQRGSGKCSPLVCICVHTDAEWICPFTQAFCVCVCVCVCQQLMNCLWYCSWWYSLLADPPPSGPSVAFSRPHDFISSSSSLQSWWTSVFGRVISLLDTWAVPLCSRVESSRPTWTTLKDFF